MSCDRQESMSSEKTGDIPWIEAKEGDWNEIQFGGEGSAQWSDGVLHLEAGVELTGSKFSGELPEMPYELELEALKEVGSDFFCGLTFPVSSKEECLTFIVGGWGGGYRLSDVVALVEHGPHAGIL